MDGTSTPRLLLVHAHPDDESIWTGGTIAHYVARGAQVVLLTCTLGEEGEIIPASLAGLASDRADQLGGYRLGELRCAHTPLRVTDQRFLGGLGRWRDSGMVWQRPGVAGAGPVAHPRALATGDFEEQARSLRAVLRDVRPQVVVTYAADGLYGHPDHVRAHDLTMAATAEDPDVRRVFHVVPAREATRSGLAELAGVEGVPFRFPEPGELPTVPDETISTVIDVEDRLPAKIDALRAHRTQVEVWRNGDGVAAYALSNHVAQPLPRAEHYMLASGDPAGCAADLFGGLPEVDHGRPGVSQ